jgi:hypothetical protein
MDRHPSSTRLGTCSEARLPTSRRPQDHRGRRRFRWPVPAPAPSRSSKPTHLPRSCASTKRSYRLSSASALSAQTVIVWRSALLGTFTIGTPRGGPAPPGCRFRPIHAKAIAPRSQMLIASSKSAIPDWLCPGHRDRVVCATSPIARAAARRLPAVDPPTGERHCLSRPARDADDSSDESSVSLGDPVS